MKGRHSFKLGGEYLRLHFVQRFIGSPGFTFNGARSGDPVADFLLGTFSSLFLDFGVRDNDDVSNAPSFFFQDEFKATPRLTLTLGVRYEPYLFWYDNHDRIDTVVIGKQSTKRPDAPPGVLFPGDPGIPRALVPADKNNFAPRLGFAWGGDRSRKRSSGPAGLPAAAGSRQGADYRKRRPWPLLRCADSGAASEAATR